MTRTSGSQLIDLLPWTRVPKNAGRMGALHLEQNFPFNFHEELASRIKASLTAGTRDVDVKIELPFDPLIYFGGLQQQGRFVRRWGGNEIESYSQLSPLLGKQWYFRILNEQINFFCCIATVFMHIQM